MQTEFMTQNSLCVGMLSLACAIRFGLERVGRLLFVRKFKLMVTISIVMTGIPAVEVWQCMLTRLSIIFIGQISKTKKLEIVGVEITPLHAKNVIFPCWYRPPTSDNDKETFEALTNLLSRLDAEGKEVYLIGDTNCDFKKPNDGPARQLHSIYNEFQFGQQIKEPTKSC